MIASRFVLRKNNPLCVCAHHVKEIPLIPPICAGVEYNRFNARIGQAARRRSRAASQQAQQQAEEQGAAQQQATAEQVENFKNAFSVCLEAKDYMVKF